MSKDSRVTKRRVTMRSGFLSKDGVVTHEATDFVNPEFLDAYVADAQAKWQVVEVSDEPDAGPGGYEGTTAVPAHLPVPNAGTVFPADKKG